MIDWGAIAAEVHRDVGEVSIACEVHTEQMSAGSNPVPTGPEVTQFSLVWLSKARALRAGLTLVDNQAAALLTISDQTASAPKPGATLRVSGTDYIIVTSEAVAPGDVAVIYRVVVQ